MSADLSNSIGGMGIFIVFINLFVFAMAIFLKEDKKNEQG